MLVNSVASVWSRGSAVNMSRGSECDGGFGSSKNGDERIAPREISRDSLGSEMRGVKSVGSRGSARSRW